MNYTAKDISVLIITYNRPDQIIECLRSIQNQTKPPFEVVIIDASNNNKTKSLVENYSNENFYISYFKREPNKIEQRNFGAKQLKGEFIQLSDDDIIFDKYYFEEVEKYLGQINDKRFGGFIGSIFERRELDRENRLGKMIKTVLSNFFQKVFMIYPLGNGNLLKSGQQQLIRNTILGVEPKKICVMGGAGCYKKIIFNDIFFDPYFKDYSAGEDLDFSLRVSLKYNLYYFPNAYFIHNHIGSSNRETGEILIDKSRLLRYFYNKYKNEYELSLFCYKWALIGSALYALIFKRNLHAFISIIKGE